MTHPSRSSLHRMLAGFALLTLCGLQAACIPEVADVEVKSFQDCSGTGYVYAAGNDGTSKAIYGFLADTCEGGLTALPGSPFLITGLTQNIGSLVAAPNGQYLFVGENGNPNAVVSFTIGDDGSLTQVSSQPEPGSGSPKIAVDPGTQQLYAATGPLGLRAYSIDASGVLVDDINGGTPYPTFNPITPVMHPSGEFLVISTASNPIDLVTRASDGSITDVPDYGASQTIYQIGIDPKGEFLAAVANISYMELLAINPGPPPTLTQVDVPTLSACTGALPFFDPTGTFLYLNCSSGTDLGFILDRSAGGSLVPIASPGTTANGIWELAWTQGAKFVYRAISNAQTMEGFSVDPATGVLTPLPGSPFPAATGAGFLTGRVAAP